MMRNRDVLIRLPLTEEEAAMFEGRWAMVVPLSEQETIEFGAIMNTTQETLQKVAQALATLQTVLETKGSKEPDIQKTLGMWLGPVRQNEALMDRARQLLGRAKFVAGSEDGKGLIQ